MNPLYLFLDGKEYTLSGVAGRFDYDLDSDPLFPRLVFVPADGDPRPRYKRHCRLGQAEWVHDLTNNFEACCIIAHELGYELEN